MSYIKSLISKYKWQIFHVSIVLFFIIFNLLVSYTIRRLNLFFIPNDSPFGFQAGIGVSSLILIFLCWSLAYYKILIKFPIPTILILAGAFSNYFEKWLFYDNVADYISVPISHFNISDLQIWIGLLMLNWDVWIGGNKQSNEHNEHKHLNKSEV